MRAAIIADDLTGAADTGVQLARAGYRTAVAFRGAPVPPSKYLDAVALDTDSRAMPAGFAAKRVVEAAHAVRDALIVYKKLDSTLRGPVAAELAAALEATGRDRAVVAPAFPAAGRTTVKGVQLVRGVPVHETEAKNDPRTPVREGHLPALLGASFPSVGSLSIEELVAPAAVRRALDDSKCIVADATREENLEALVRAVIDPSEVLWAGSAGSAVRALAEVAAGLSDEGLIDALVLTGGETAVGVGWRLGAVGIRLEGEVEPGIPVGILIGPSPYRVVTKAGGFGGPDTLVRVVEKLRGKD